MFYGGHSSVVERRFVIPNVAGSIPAVHPKKARKPDVSPQGFIFLLKCSGSSIG